MIVGILIALAICIAIIVVVVVFLLRRKKKSKVENPQNVDLVATPPETSTKSPNTYQNVSKVAEPQHSYLNTSEISQTPPPPTTQQTNNYASVSSVSNQEAQYANRPVGKSQYANASDTKFQNQEQYANATEITSKQTNNQYANSTQIS